MRPAMGLRNLIVGPFGLATQSARGSSSQGAGFLDSLSVAHEDDRRFVTGLTDRHLTFTLTTTTTPGQVTVETHIWFENLFGRIYLMAVWPAHHLILRAMLRKLAVGSS